MPLLPHTPKRLGRLAEPLLWLGAALCGSLLLSASLSAGAAARQAQAFGSHTAHPLRDFSDDNNRAADPAKAAAVTGRLQIPALGLSVPILSDVDTPTLRRGAGHVPGTATPGGLGTMALAAHRDTFFRPVRRIARGMEIRVSDATGTYRYQVDSTEIVSPEQVEVLAIRDRPELALVTCYPFDFIGSAPKRFIVHARLLSLFPE